MNRTQISKMFQTMRLNQRTPTVLSLRDGQFVTGKVEKFYPGNKALIQINGHRIVAEVDSPIVSNKNYLLQVKSSHPSIHLQVIHNEAVKNSEDVAEKILRQFNLKGSRSELALLTELIKGEVPIRRENVLPLLQLIKNNGMNDTNVLKEMLIRQLPLTQSVYDAISQRLNQHLSYAQLVNQTQQSLLTEINTNEKMQLNNYLSLISNQPLRNENVVQSFVFQALLEVGRNDPTTFELFKQAGLIRENVDFQTWSSQWRSWASQNQVPLLTLNEQSNLPFNIKSSDITNAILRLTNEQLPMTKQQIQALNSLFNELKMIQTNNSGSLNKVSHLMQQVNLNHLSEMTARGTFINQLMNSIQQGQLNDVRQLLNSEEGQQLLNDLNARLNEQVLGRHERAFTFWQMVALNHDGLNQPDSFHTKLQAFLQLTQFEGATNKLDNYPSLLSLLQAASSQASSQSLSESMNQLQQIFQAIHLSFNETNREWLQFLVQFPKEVFHLNEDMWLEFEGKRDQDGKIDSSHARILFYLNLPNLNETVIDMQVQNRNIHLTIYNEHVESLKHFSKTIVNGLEQMLEQKNYHLELIHFLPYKETNEKQMRQFELQDFNFTEGIDIKI